MRFFDIAIALRSASASVASFFRRRPSGPPRAPHWTEEEAFTDPRRWQPVTVLATPAELAPDGRLPEPLARLDELIEVRLKPAPGGRGTELSARTRPGAKPDSARWRGEDPARRIRQALMQVKQLVEVGEVLSIDPRPAGKRRRPAAGLLVDLMMGDADQEGVL